MWNYLRWSTGPHTEIVYLMQDNTNDSTSILDTDLDKGVQYEPIIYK